MKYKMQIVNREELSIVNKPKSLGFKTLAAETNHSFSGAELPQQFAVSH